MKGLLLLSAAALTLLASGAWAEVLHSPENESHASALMLDWDGDSFVPNPAFTPAPWIGNGDTDGESFSFTDKDGDGGSHKTLGDDPPTPTPEPSFLNLLLAAMLACGLLAARRLRTHHS
jgi:hypothetical protein